MSDAKIEATIGLRTGPLESGLHRAQSMVNKFKKSTSTAVGGAMSFASGPVVAAIGAATAAFSLAKIAATSFHKAASAEQTQTAFTTLLGSAERAKAVLAQLKGFSDVTPFEPGPIIAAGRSLLAMGTDAKDLIPTLRKIGDVASGLGGGEEGLEGLVELFSKARTQGRLYGEEIRQLTGRGVPVIQEFAKQFGVTEDQVHKLGEEGKITFANLDQAFTSLTGKGGKFAGGMAAQSGTMLGILSTVQGRISGLFTKLGTPINEALKPFVGMALPILDRLGPIVSRAGAAVGVFIKSISTLFANVGKGTIVVDGFRLAATSISDILWIAAKVGFGKAVNALVGLLVGTVDALIAGIGGGIGLIFNGSLWEMIAAGLMGSLLRAAGVMLRAFSLPITFINAGIEKAFQVVFEAVDYLKLGFGMAGAVIRASFAFAKQELANLIGKLPDKARKFLGLGKVEGGGKQSFGEFLAPELAASAKGAQEPRATDSFADLQKKFAGRAAEDIKNLERQADSAFAGAKTAGGALAPNLGKMKDAMQAAFKSNSGAQNVVDVRADQAQLANLSKNGALRQQTEARAVEAAKADAKGSSGWAGDGKGWRFDSLGNNPLSTGGLTGGGLKAASLLAPKLTGGLGLAPTISADSLARIGGGGNVSKGGEHLNEAKQQTVILRDIAKKVGSGKELKLM